jgi:DNA repair exonuclease SbcCD ATPase subunit
VEEPRAAAEIKSYEARVVNYTNEVADQMKAKERLRALRSKLRQAKEDHSDLKSEKFVDDSKLLGSIEKLTDEIIGAKVLLELLVEEADRYKFWVEGFGNAGIKSHLLDHVVPILNKRAQKYAQTLMEGIDVSFSAQKRLKSGELRDKFDITVTNSHGADGYHGNSGGEKRKIDIIVARTLQSLEEDRSSMTCNLSWWDEVFESLDETSCEAVMTMLREEATNRPAVFVISHLDWLKPHFTRILRVTKSGGFSQIEWG